MAVPLQKGGGSKVCAIKEKKIFFCLKVFFNGEVPTAVKLGGMGVKALMALPIKKNQKKSQLP